MNGQFFKIIERYESPKERLTEMMEQTADMFYAYGINACGIDEDSWEIYLLPENFLITMPSSNSWIIKASEQTANNNRDSQILDLLDKEAADIDFLQYVKPSFNSLEYNDRLILAVKYFLPEKKRSVCWKLEITNRKTWAQRVSAAEDKLIMFMQLDFYGYKNEDLPGEILSMDVITNRRKLAAYDKKIFR